MASGSPSGLLTAAPIIALILTLVNIGVTILGLNMNNMLASHREYRKEKRAKLDAISNRLDEIEAQAVEFNTAESFNPALREKLLRGITIVKSRIDHLGNPADQILDQLFMVMRTVILDNGAVAEEFESIPSEDDRITEMAMRKEEVLDFLERRYEMEFAVTPNTLVRRLGGLQPKPKALRPRTSISSFNDEQGQAN